MLSDLFFGAVPIYESLCCEDGTSAALARQITAAAETVYAELSEHGTDAWETLQAAEAQRDRQRMFRAFCAGMQLAFDIWTELRQPQGPA